MVGTATLRSITRRPDVNSIREPMARPPWLGLMRDRSESGWPRQGSWRAGMAGWLSNSERRAVGQEDGLFPGPVL